MSGTERDRLRGAASRMSVTLDAIVDRTAQGGSFSALDPKLNTVALIYRDTFANLGTYFDAWVNNLDPGAPIVTQLIVTMATVDELFQQHRLRGALQQTHAILSALPGKPDFPPITLPPVPGSDD